VLELVGRCRSVDSCSLRSILPSPGRLGCLRKVFRRSPRQSRGDRPS
jgi:hypothetical protein